MTSVVHLVNLVGLFLSHEFKLGVTVENLVLKTRPQHERRYEVNQNLVGLGSHANHVLVPNITLNVELLKLLRQELAILFRESVCGELGDPCFHIVGAVVKEPYRYGERREFKITRHNLHTVWIPLLSKLCEQRRNASAKCRSPVRLALTVIV